MVALVKLLFSQDGAMGIGSMIIFVAMILVAGMAASVIVQTMNMMNQQALDTGRETIREVATGVEVTHVSGKINSSNITQLAIFIGPIAGSDDIDLRYLYLSLSDTDITVILYYDSNYFTDTVSNGLFDSLDISGLDAASFGIIEIRDIDNSCSATSPIVNGQDIIVLMVNASACFGNGSSTSGIGPRTEISGGVYPEVGVRGIIRCTTPAAFINSVVELQ